MTTDQEYKINEFFIELDKTLGPNHPLIVLHGPAYQFREYVEKIAQELQEADEELYGTSKWTKSKAQVERELEQAENELRVMKNDVDSEIDELENAVEEISEEIDKCIEDGDTPVDVSLDKIKDCIKELKNTIW